MNQEQTNPKDDKPLESWKEIAVYLQRDVRTVARWERSERLPVHRHHHGRGSSVYAYPGELDAWRTARQPETGAKLERPSWYRLIPAAAGGTALVAVAAVVLWGPIMNPPDPLIEAAEASGVVVRQVWTGPDVDIMGTPSPDGRFLSYVHWATGDLALRDLEAGKHHLLTRKGSWKDSNSYAEFSVISPDGSRVAYAWSNPGYELRIVGTDASESTLLYRNDEIPYLVPKGWTPDGKQVLAVFFRKDGTTQIALISVDDQSVRVVKTLDWDDRVEACLSPDGRYIAYDASKEGPSGPRDIFLLAADGSREIPLVTHVANDMSPIWTPDGNWVAFISDRTGTASLWALRVADGRPQGRPVLFKRDIGTSSALGFSDHGALFYGVGSGQQDVYIASLDFDEGKTTNPPARGAERFLGSNSAPEWSPDGRRLAYFSKREAAGSTVLCVRSLETEEERDLPLQLSLNRPQLNRPRWSPDGRSLTVLGTDRRGRGGIYRVDVETGEQTALAQSHPDHFLTFHVWSRDGEEIFFTRSDQQSKNVRVVARNIKSEKERVLHRVETFVGGIALSPDGGQLAVLISSRGRSVVKMIPVDGGEVREIDPGRYIVVNMLAWTADGRRLLLGIHLNNGQREVWLVPAEGGEPRKLDFETGQRMAGFTMHPDGKRIAFTGGGYDNEIWVMENFLPDLSETRAAK